MSVDQERLDAARRKEIVNEFVSGGIGSFATRFIEGLLDELAAKLLSEKNAIIAQQSQEMATLRANLDESSNLNEELEAAGTTLLEENEKSSAAIEHLESGKAALEQSVAELCASIDELTNHNAKHETAIARLTQEVHTLQAANEDLSTQCHDMQENLLHTVLEPLQDKYTAEIEGLEEQVVTLQARCQEVEQVNQSQLAGFEQGALELQAQYQQQLSDLSDQLEAAQVVQSPGQHQDEVVQSPGQDQEQVEEESVVTEKEAAPSKPRFTPMQVEEGLPTAEEESPTSKSVTLGALQDQRVRLRSVAILERPHQRPVGKVIGENAFNRGDFVCPLSKKQMIEPVIAADNHSYERSAIEQWIRSARDNDEPIQSPVTAEELDHTNLVLNSFLLQQIQEQQASTAGEA